MISVGIDAAKDKSTVCIIKQTGEIIRNSYDIKHTKDDLEDFPVLYMQVDELEHFCFDSCYNMSIKI